MIDKDNIDKYDDIINLPHPTSTKHPRMSLENRAAQFSPFAALTGHDEAIRETARLTDEKIELDEDTKVALDGKLQIIQENLKAKMPVSITYFKPDELKTGGEYVTYTGVVTKIDAYEHMLIVEDGANIPVEQIVEIEL